MKNITVSLPTVDIAVIDKIALEHTGRNRSLALVKVISDWLKIKEYSGIDDDLLTKATSIHKSDIKHGDKDYSKRLYKAIESLIPDLNQIQKNSLYIGHTEYKYLETLKLRLRIKPINKTKILNVRFTPYFLEGDELININVDTLSMTAEPINKAIDILCHVVLPIELTKSCGFEFTEVIKAT